MTFKNANNFETNSTVTFALLQAYITVCWSSNCRKHAVSGFKHKQIPELCERKRMTS